MRAGLVFLVKKIGDQTVAWQKILTTHNLGTVRHTIKQHMSQYPNASFFTPEDRETLRQCLAVIFNIEKEGPPGEHNIQPSQKVGDVIGRLCDNWESTENRWTFIGSILKHPVPTSEANFSVSSFGVIGPLEGAKGLRQSLHPEGYTPDTRFFFDPSSALTTDNSQSKEIKMTPIQVTKQVNINGVNAANISDEAHYDMIAAQEANVAKLKLIKNKPNALKEKIKTLEQGIQDLVSFMNERDAAKYPTVKSVAAKTTK